MLKKVDIDLIRLYGLNPLKNRQFNMMRSISKWI